MKPIKLPEPPGSPLRGPDAFGGGFHGAIRRAVVIGNGVPGSENQSIGLVRALGLTDRHLLYRVTRPSGGINDWLSWLSVSLHKKLNCIIRRIRVYSYNLLAARNTKFVRGVENCGSIGLSSVLEADVNKIVSIAHENFDKDGPLLVVASGRDTISIASSIRKLASDKVFVVQIQHPRVLLQRFDMVITPKHDYYPLTPQAQAQVPRIFRRWITPREPPDKHVVLTFGALHHIDSAALRGAAILWHNELSFLPKPLLVVNIGGPTRHCRYGVDLAKQLTDSLHNVITTCGTVRISFSRRTPKKVSGVVAEELSRHPKVQIWDGNEPNPHIGHLAWADAFVVTADSVTMLSEACSTGKPVYVIGGERCTWKMSEFHCSLRERGVVRPFMGSEDISQTWSYPPLNDTVEAANHVRTAVAQRGWELV